MGLKQSKVALTTAQWDDLKVIAKQRHVSVSALLREIVDHGLTRYIRKEPPKS